MKKTGQYLLMIILVTAAFAGGAVFFPHNPAPSATAGQLSLDEQEATVLAVKKVMPAVVSIVVEREVDIITKDENGNNKVTQKIEQLKEGTGFIISSDGYILTNRHVVKVNDLNRSRYQVFLNNGQRYYAQFIGNDPLKDLAVLKIFDKDLPYVELGNSAELAQGMSVMAIGNSLGLYKNSVTKGIVSALNRDLSASDSQGNNKENFDNLIQTDAEINLGNSGGPLVNLEGKVVGVNTAIDQSGSSIGFAIPINDVRVIVESIKELNRIVRPRLGVRYLVITPDIARENNLLVNNGAWVRSNADGEPGVLPDSPADKGGVWEDDIIFEVNAIPINETNKLFNIIQNYKPGSRIGLKIYRGDKVVIREVILDEYKE